MNNPLIKVSVKWGLIFTLVSSISLISTYIFGFSTNMFIGLIVGIVSITITIVLMVLANRDYRNTYLNGYIKYWQCFLNNLFVFIISAFLINIISYILYGIIDVDAFNKSIEDQLSMLNANPNVPQEWKESQLDALINMTPIKSSILNFFRSVIFGAILSLIVSIFTRKKNNSFEGAIKEIE